ncbi:MAG: heme exporter protein CcmD [Rhizobiaceae bacterium]
MDHPWFVAAAYGISAIVIGGVVLWALLDGRGRRRGIVELETSGVRRRSERNEAGEA